MSVLERCDALSNMKRGLLLEAQKIWGCEIRIDQMNENAWFGYLSVVDLLSDVGQSISHRKVVVEDAIIERPSLPSILELLADFHVKMNQHEVAILLYEDMSGIKPLNSRQLAKYLSSSMQVNTESLEVLMERLIYQRDKVTDAALLVPIARYLPIKGRKKELSLFFFRFLQLVDDHRIDLLVDMTSVLENSGDFPEKELICTQLALKAITTCKRVDGFYYHEQLARFLLNQGFVEESLVILEILRQKGFESAEIWEDIGDLFVMMKEGDPIAAYQQALELAPMNAIVILKTARLLLQEGDVSGAREIIEDARERGIETPGLLSLLAECYYMLGEYNDAREMAMKSLSMNAEDSKALLLLSKIYLKLGDPRKALNNIFSLVKEGLNEDSELWVIVAESLIQLGRLEDSLKLYDWLIEQTSSKKEYQLAKLQVLLELKRSREAVRLARKLVRENPRDGELWRQLARCYLLHEELKEHFEIARQYLETSLLLRPDDYYTLLDLGRANEKLGNEKKAKIYYEAALEQRPNDPIALFRLSMLALSCGNFQELLSRIKTVIILDPTNRLAIEMLGQALIQEIIDSQEYKGTLLLVHSVLEEASPDVQSHLPLYLLELGFKVPALELARKIYDTIPFHSIMATLALAASLVANGIMLAEAGMMLVELLEKIPFSSELRYWLGQYELSQNNYEEAAKHLSIARILDPTKSKYWDEELWARAMDSQPLDELLPLCNAALQRFPKNTELLLTIGMIYYMYHLPQEALHVLEECIDVNPRFIKPWILIARITKNMKSIQESIAILNEARFFNPESTEIRDLLQRYQEELERETESTLVKMSESSNDSLVLERTIDFEEQLQPSVLVKEIKNLYGREELKKVEKLIKKYLNRELVLNDRLFLLQMLARIKIDQYRFKEAFFYIDQCYSIDLLNSRTNEVLFLGIKILGIEVDALKLLKDVIKLFDLSPRSWMSYLTADSISMLMTLELLLDSLQKTLRNDPDDSLSWMYLSLIFRTLQLHQSFKKAFFHAIDRRTPEETGSIQLYLFLKDSLEL